ncbi:MAG: hypothetical protein RBQ81_06330 [Arcobacteraceae bacterium]|jgi:hypothetical protein|nr:hypothetical protein [Arcobacteraceae bacterium]MDY0365454.1 hypothetical protein [Arcobacteraceae bacterium]
MTQKELDALIENGDFEHEIKGSKQNKKLETHAVKQLSDVTKESEVKATLVFDNLDKVLENLDFIGEDPFETIKAVDNIKNIIFETMEIMQYQDIHRQKIERVIHTMKELYMMMGASLQELDVDIAPSAKYICGDDCNDDLIDSDELEKLIAEANS